MEDVGTAQDRERGQEAAEGPAADGHPAQVEVVGVLLGHALQRVDLVVERGARQVAADRALEVGAPARGAAAVGHDDGEALLGEPLALQERAPPVEHPLRVRPAVRVHQHRQPAGALLVPRGQHHGGGQLAAAGTAE